MTPIPPVLPPITIPKERGIRDHRPHLRPPTPIADTALAQRWGLPYRPNSVSEATETPASVGMVNFVNSSAHITVEEMGQYAVNHAGMLRTPYSGNRIEHAVELGIVWALDNGCFNRYEPAAIVRMLERFRGLPGCKFAVVPDVVGSHEETLLLFRAWLGTFQRLGYPPAFVLQNGVTVDTVPYGSIAAVFIGGDTPFKYSDVVREIAKIARVRGLWVHMGRVNTLQRLIYAQSIGCDSFDGTSYSMFSRTNIRKHLPAYTGERQMNIWEIE